MRQAALERLLDRAESLCAERGARLTAQRRQVLGLVCAAEKPVTAYELLDQLRETVRNPAPPTVYRALDFLLEQGLIHKLESLHAFVGCTHPGHPHASQFLICAQCGLVDELEDPAVSRSLETAARDTGFETCKPVVELLGTCAQCRGKG